MGLRIIHDERNQHACMYCSTSEWAFGPVAYGENALKKLEAFQRFLGVDARRLRMDELERKWSEFFIKYENEVENGQT